jgi:hypothetical protein
MPRSQDSTGPAEPPRKLKRSKKGGSQTETEMTLVNVTVTDPIGRLVTGLEQEQFPRVRKRRGAGNRAFTSEDVPYRSA